jgi:hypothetical protein
LRCKILKWLTLARRTLRLDEVGEALNYDFSEGVSSLPHSLLHSADNLELFCGSLATVRDRNIDLVRIMAQEYLQRSPDDLHLQSSLRNFLVDAGMENARLTGICTSYLTSHDSFSTVRHEREDDDTADDGSKRLRFARPFIYYASFNWLHSLTASDMQTLMDTKSTLLPFRKSRSFLTWVELCMRLNHASCGTLRFMLQTLLSSLPGQSDAPAAMPLFHDLISLLRFWGELLPPTTNHILSCAGAVAERSPPNRPPEQVSLEMPRNPRCSGRK